MAFEFSTTPVVGTGTISIAKGSTTVTGVGTNFVNQGLNGTILLVNGYNVLITAVASATAMTIANAPNWNIVSQAFKIAQTSTNISMYSVENDLSGLAALDGITYTVTGTGVGVFRTANIGLFQLKIFGTFNHNPETDLLIQSRVGFGGTNRSIDVQSGGHWNYGNELTGANGKKTYTNACGYKNTGIALNGYQYQWLEIRSGGKLTHKGGVLEFSSGITINDGGAYDQYAGEWLFKNNLPVSTPQIYASTQANADLIVIRNLALNCTVAGGIPLINHSSAFAPTVLNVELKCGGIRDTKAGSSPLPLSNFRTLNNVAAYDIAFETQNSSNYHAQRIVGYDKTPVYFRFGASQQNGGISELRRIIRHELVNNQGLATDSIIYCKEKNNGNRGVIGSVDYTNTATTILSTTNGAVESDVLTQVAWAVISVNNGQVALDKRYNTDDTVSIHIWSFLHNYDTVDVPYIGIDKVINKRTRLSDVRISKTELQTGNLTTITNLDDLYDRAKFWKTRPIAANLEYPSIDSLPINANGTELDLGNLNLVISSTADVFSINTSTNTATIKSNVLNAGVKYKSLKTTGIVTGAISAGFSDANGNSYLTFDSIDSWKVYSDAGRTNQIGIGTGNAIYRFNYLVGTKYYLTVMQGITQFLMEVTPEAIGETVVTLSTQALLIALTDKTLTLPQIEASTVLAKKNQLVKINEGLKLLSNFEPYDGELP